MSGLFVTLVNIIIWLVILGVIWFLVGMLPLPAPFGLIIKIIFIVLAILVILSMFGLINVGVPRLYK